MKMTEDIGFAIKNSSSTNTTKGIYKTINAGKTWSKVFDNPFTDFDFITEDLAFSVSKSSTTGNSPGTYKSEDGGKTWTEVVC